MIAASVKEETGTDIRIATTLGLLVDGRELTKSDAALGRWVSSEFRQVWHRLQYEAGKVVERKIRALCGGRLPPGVPAKISALIDKLERRCRRCDTAAALLRQLTIEERWERFDTTLAARVKAVLVPMFERAGYRLAQSRWAGGDNSYFVDIVERFESPSVSRSSSKVWSDNGKWSGRSCTTTFRIRRTWVRDVGSKAVVAVKGREVVVLDRREGELLVVMPGKGFDLYTQWVKEER